VPETLVAPLRDLEKYFTNLWQDAHFRKTFLDDLEHYAGRPTPIYFAKRLSEHAGGAKIFLKREDLLHTGAHKINNTIGQALIANAMGKKE